MFDNPTTLIASALSENVSDVHISAHDDHFCVRCRSKGILSHVATLSTVHGRTLTQQIKAICTMNIAESRVPQDGRFSMAQPHLCDVRVSTHPSLHGENLVLRVFKTKGDVSLETLGFESQTLERIRECLQSEHGMVLVAGPTGAGKTTTLHALLKGLESNASNIMTLEDPVEIRLSGAVQTDLSVLPKMDFASGLRSILRQDPDVILIGEIRDSETARLAVQAAMTGHRVFASIHAFDTVGVFARLMNLGIPVQECLPHVNAVICQRLVLHEQEIRPIAEVWNAHQLPPHAKYQASDLQAIASLFNPDNFSGIADSLSRLAARFT